MSLTVSGCGRSLYDARDAFESEDAAVDAPSLDAPSLDASTQIDASLDAPTFDVPTLDAFSLDAFSLDAAAVDGGVDADGPCVHIESAGGAIARTEGHDALGTGAFTFEAWVRTPASLGSRVVVILGNREGSVPYQGYLFGFYSGVPFVQLSDTPNIRCGPTLVDEAWHHVAFIRDGSGALSCFVDFAPHVPDFPASLRDLPRVASLVVGDDSTAPGSSLDAGLWMARVWRVPRDATQLAATSSAPLGGGAGLAFEIWLDDVTMPTSVPVLSVGTTVSSAVLESTTTWTAGCPVP